MFQHQNIYSNPSKYINSGTIDAIQFFVIGSDEVNDLSNVRLINKEIFHGNEPIEGGANDLRLGTTEQSYRCKTCCNGKLNCPGHLGSIELKYPVKNPDFRDKLLKWLKVCCFNCGYPVIKKKIRASRKNLLGEYVKESRSVKRCEYCNARHAHVIKDKRLTLQFYKIYKDDEKERKEIFYNHQIFDVVNKIPDEIVMQLGKPLCSHPRKFVLTSIIASPTTLRPDVRKIGSGRSNNNDITTFLKTIISINDSLPSQIPPLTGIESEDRNYEALTRNYYNLDQHVYDMIRGSSATSAQYKIVSSNNKPMISLSQRLPQKEGRFRKNIMGKRVFNASRSVITGDPMMPINVVGIPLYVATTIQIPEIVQPYNKERLNAIYMNRRNVYPGWSRLIKAIDGKPYEVSRFPKDYKLQEGDILFRDMIDGDPVCFGRQPSLLYSNLSGFKIKVLMTESTFRMNVSSCNFFNADFDGDAMLIVVPTSVVTRNEVENMSAAKNWFISYKDQVPTVGLFQDSLIGAAKFTTNGTNFDKWHAMQGFAHVNTTTERNVVFDKQRYTSREVISKILPKVNLTGKKPSYYMQQYTPYISYDPQNIKVEIDRGELNKGILDKKTVGQNSSGSLFQVINNTYGPEKAMETIFAMQQCISNFQLYQGFTVGIEDINLPEHVTKGIKENIVTMLNDARDVTKKYNDRKLYAPIGRTLESYYEELVVAALNPGDEFVTPILNYVDIENNGIVELVIHGSKGKLPNIISINGAIGQQDVNGFRAPKQFGWKRTSPYFTRYDMEPEANGYISQSFREGVPSKTFMFIAQEARHGLTNNALSTSVSGEQNRTAIKNLESLITSCLRSLNIDNKIVQIVYADTGIDPRKLVSVKFPTVMISDDEFKKTFKTELKDVPSKFRNKQVEKLLNDEFKSIENDRNEYRKIFFKVENYDFKYLFTDEWKSPVNIFKIVEDVKFNNRDLLKENGLNPIQAIERVQRLCQVLPYQYLNKVMEVTKAKIPEHFIKCTKMLQILIRSHLCIKKLINDNITDSLLEIIIRDIINTFGKALIDYGMPMGIIAAQCISEPLTQFVLDSKHRSGVGGGSKTNPIVRYKEILSVKPTNKMKNPSMILRVKKEFEDNKAAVQEIANHIEMLRLERFISKVRIFFEKYGDPVHPTYRDEKSMIKSFESRHHGIKMPGDLLDWCIRFELNKEEMIFKSMTLETIILALKKAFKELFIVYTPENSPIIIIRCYIRASLFKKIKNVKVGEDIIKSMIEYMYELRQTVIRGIDKILAAEVIEYVRSVKEDNGSISSGKIFAIGTNGSNIDDILKVSGLDLRYCITDSILEVNELLGIEAARESIINELKIALKDIAPIHCAVYADAMCYPGIVTSIEKTGLNIREPNNILLRSSYRYPVQTLEEASEMGVLDTIYGISGPLCIGRPPNIGTTYSEVLINQNFVKKHTKTLDEKLAEL